VALSFIFLKTVIQKLKTHFARCGIPDILYSDNGPYNGKVESAVKTAKRLMAKAKRAGTDSSPAMALMGRRTKTLLIMSENLLGPVMANCQPENFKERQQRQAKYYDTSVKDLTELQRDDRVRFQPLTGQKQWWQRATVVRPVEQRSYEVKTEQEQVFRRNRRHLRKSREIEEDFPTVEDPGTEPIDRAPADAQLHLSTHTFVCEIRHKITIIRVFIFGSCFHFSTSNL
uniref:Integrase catalytic domain-containing protein n=1 Tax=Salmo trutta TaxID=8032 RepID=A0A673XZC2_SALTR